jgi:hypothetical protein
LPLRVVGLVLGSIYDQSHLLNLSLSRGLLQTPLNGQADSSLEIRRILLLTRLRENAKGMTLSQMTKGVAKVAGWGVSGTPLSQSVRAVLQSLIDEKLIVVEDKFVISSKGRQYLEDPLKWRLDVGTVEEVERKLFWNSIYAVFDRAFARLRSRSQAST